MTKEKFAELILENEEQWLCHLDGRHFHSKMAGEYVLKRQNRKIFVSGV